MEKLKFRAYLKNIRGLNKHHFDTHGRMYEVLMIDWENEEIRVRVPSELTFSFKDVEIIVKRFGLSVSSQTRDI